MILRAMHDMLNILIVFLIAAQVSGQNYVGSFTPNQNVPASHPPYGPASRPWLAVQSPVPGPGPVPLKRPYNPGVAPRPYQPAFIPRPLPGRAWPRPQLPQTLYSDWIKRRTKDIHSEPNDAGIKSLETLALEYHNEHRRLHGVPDLELDHAISLQAAQFAASIADNGLRHSNPQERPYQGENIILGCKAYGKGMSVFEAVKEWYSSVCHCDFNNPADNEKSRPFKQIVWKSTQKLGIGKADFKRGVFNCTVIVARYTPQGNTGNQETFRANVEKGLFVPESCQYITNTKDRADFVEPPRGNKCKHVPGFRGQLLEESSVCSLKDIFQIFGASYRKGKQAFKIVL